MIAREDRGTVAVIRLAHGKVSALDLDLCSALTTELARAWSDPAVHAAIAAYLERTVGRK